MYAGTRHGANAARARSDDGKTAGPDNVPHPSGEKKIRTPDARPSHHIGSRADPTIPLNTCPLRADTRLGPGGTLRGCRPPNRLAGTRSTSIGVVACTAGFLPSRRRTAGGVLGEGSRPKGDEHDHEDDREHDHQGPHQVQGDARPPLTPTSTTWIPSRHLLEIPPRPAGRNAEWIPSLSPPHRGARPGSD